MNVTNTMFNVKYFGLSSCQLKNERTTSNIIGNPCSHQLTLKLTIGKVNTKGCCVLSFFDLTFLLPIFKVVFYFRYKTTVEQINQRISSLVEAGCSANEMSEVKSSVLGLKVNLLKSIRRWNGTFGKILAQQVWSLKFYFVSILLALKDHCKNICFYRHIIKVCLSCFWQCPGTFAPKRVCKFHKGAESAQKPFKGPRTRREICYR